MEELEIKKLLELIEQWTRAETMARHAPLLSPDFTNYAKIQIEKEDAIRELVFGTANLIELGLKWGLLKDKKTQTKDDLKQQFQQLQKDIAAMTGT